ncbi:TSUP family transporter [Futiania mangrovi]|uniref:Probable membrane transporter protein n=1 Tax=Futiania mangrovi TaxID=2959716 RepID=A0A9J6PFI1_9PROT|nr:TSUP family transporter [Futiania mangrovii]MCP1336555.1 TSUP family transporter [Futiania mangrovii]
MPELVPPELGTIAAYALVGLAAVTSFITAAFGIGGGVVLIAVMAVLMPPAALIPVHGVVQFGSNVGRFFLMLRHVRWDVLGAFGAGSVAGAAGGGLVAVDLPPALVQIGLAAFVLYSAWGPSPDLGRAGLLAGGAISSFLTMFFGATGPFVAGVVKTLRLDRMTHVGTFSACMVLQHGVKVAAFGVLGFAFGPWVPLMAGMVAAGFLGTLAGRAVLTRTADARFHLVLNLLLTALAARLLWSGVTGLFG